MKKALILSFLIIMIVAFSGCDWLQKEEVEEQVDSSEISTDNWLTYENEEVGFTMKYPNDWKVNDPSSNNNFYIQTTIISEAPIELEGEIMDMSYQPKLKQDIIEQKQEIENSKVGQSNIIALSDTIKSKLYFGATEGNCLLRHYTLFKNDHRITIYTCVGYDVILDKDEITSEVQEKIDVLDDIVNTIEFLEIKIEDWLTYENEEYGFSFKYPSKWGQGWKGFISKEVQDKNKDGHVFDFGLTKEKIQIFSVFVSDKKIEETLELNDHFGEVSDRVVTYNNIDWFQLNHGIYYGYITKIDDLTFIVYQANYFSNREEEEGIELFNEILEDFQIN